MTNLYRLQRINAITKQLADMTREIQDLGDVQALLLADVLDQHLTKVASTLQARAESPTLRMMDQLYGPNQPRGDYDHAKQSAEPHQDSHRADQTQGPLTRTKVPNSSGAGSPEIEGVGNPSEVLGLPGRGFGPVRPVEGGQLHGNNVPTLDGPTVEGTPGETHTRKSHGLSMAEGRSPHDGCAYLDPDDGNTDGKAWWVR